MSYTTNYLAEASQVIDALDTASIDRMVEMLVVLRERGGRLFFLGVGGGAGHVSGTCLYPIQTCRCPL